MKRGEVWWVNFDPSVGTEIRKKRPAVILSNDLSNKYITRLQVVPLTTNVENLYPSEAYVTLNGKQNKAMGDQITTVRKERLDRKVGKLSANDMDMIERAVKIQLGFVG